MDCLFCKIIKGEIPIHQKLYEDENCLAFLDIAPINPGHILLITKKHYENIYELPDEILGKLAPIIKKMAIAAKKGMNADGINIGMNNESPAGQIVPHIHFHIIPRFSNDNLRHWSGKSYINSEAAKTAEKIKLFL